MLYIKCTIHNNILYINNLSDRHNVNLKGLILDETRMRLVCFRKVFIIPYHLLPIVELPLRKRKLHCDTLCTLEWIFGDVMSFDFPIKSIVYFE